MSAGTLVYPLGRKASSTGGWGQGTHSYSAAPNNWESDNAVDLMVPKGTPVYAVADGTIGSEFGRLSGGGGRFAGIRLHLITKGDEWYYAHLDSTAPGIKPGAHVKQGQLLGHSGVANGVAHLHLGEKAGYAAHKPAHLAQILGLKPNGKVTAAVAQTVSDSGGKGQGQATVDKNTGVDPVGDTAGAVTDAINAVFGGWLTTVEKDALKVLLYAIFISAGAALTGYGLVKLLGADDKLAAVTQRAQQAAELAAVAA